MNRWEEQGWQEEDLDKLELSFLQRIIACKEPEGVDCTVTYATYLNMVGVNPDNYPAFFRMLNTRNHWVVDALLGDNDPETFFSSVQPNYFIIRECFRALTNSGPGGLYPQSLLVYLGLVKQNYTNPGEGYRVYPLSTEDLNNLGKHLDEEQDQTYPLNRSILGILDDIASLLDPGNIVDDQDVLRVATQANSIRGKFLDSTKSLRESIPDLLLQREDYTQNEIAPTSA
jgi:hypothetical protein